MKKMLSLIGALVMSALILVACGGGAAPSIAGSAGESYMMEAPAAPAMDMAYSEEAASKPISNSGGGTQATTVERLVLRNAELSIVVADVEGRMVDIQSMAQRMGGYVVSSNLYQTYVREGVYTPEGRMVIRVSAENLQDALEQIKQGVVEVKNETVSGEDVTAQYVDLKSRLKNYEAAESQLEEIMKTTTEAEDVINIFNQLVYYREQIELVKGQMKYYEEAAALSSISVYLIAEEKEKPFEVGGWKLSGTAREAAQDLVYFYQGFMRFLIRFVIYTLPVLITVFIPFYLAFLAARGFFRWAGGKKKKIEPQETAEKK